MMGAVRMITVGILNLVLGISVTASSQEFGCAENWLQGEARVIDLGGEKFRVERLGAQCTVRTHAAAGARVELLSCDSLRVVDEKLQCAQGPNTLTHSASQLKQLKTEKAEYDKQYPDVCLKLRRKSFLAPKSARVGSIKVSFRLRGDFCTVLRGDDEVAECQEIRLHPNKLICRLGAGTDELTELALHEGGGRLRIEELNKMAYLDLCAFVPHGKRRLFGIGRARLNLESRGAGCTVDSREFCHHVYVREDSVLCRRGAVSSSVYPGPFPESDRLTLMLELLGEVLHEGLPAHGTLRMTQVKELKRTSRILLHAAPALPTDRMPAQIGQ